MVTDVTQPGHHHCTAGLDAQELALGARIASIDPLPWLQVFDLLLSQLPNVGAVCVSHVCIIRLINLRVNKFLRVRHV